VLGDNIFFGADLSHRLRRVVQRERGATIFSYRMSSIPKRTASSNWMRRGARFRSRKSQSIPNRTMP
jgi:hypothetical protein